MNGIRYEIGMYKIGIGIEIEMYEIRMYEIYETYAETYVIKKTRVIQRHTCEYTKCINVQALTCEVTTSEK